MDNTKTRYNFTGWHVAAYRYLVLFKKHKAIADEKEYLRILNHFERQNNTTISDNLSNPQSKYHLLYNLSNASEKRLEYVGPQL